MKVLIVAIISMITLNIHAQSKDEIIDELQKVLKEHCISTQLKNAEIYYNTGEKILDFGLRYDLDTTRLTYEFAGTASEPIHMLQFVRDAKPNSSTSFFFDNKKSVYHVLDLIYALKKLE
ncbi:hypothetical protein U8527_09975 [Kordia algicida OT-1]|uniref:Uncharacterized protein n=1 Tax=Kordia algicida OT-1 TaxID=391587 RepID=A9DVJ6_9FLAO|nr:hypothetical protein [Kordia algicida]EDP96430.1 hypothetical protein KAOT1_03437 [Kordia algicida OT-1]